MKISFIFSLILLFISGIVYAQQIPTMENNQIVDGKEEGKWVVWYDKDNLFTMNEDEVVSYYIIHYSNGLKNGEIKGYWANGQLLTQGVFKDGKETGNWEFYDEEGFVSMEKNYDLTEKEEEWSALYYETANLWVEDKYAEALVIAIETQEFAERELGDRHLNYIVSLDALGQLYAQVNENDKAISNYLEALEIIKTKYGTKHEIYLPILKQLGQVHQNAGNYLKAIANYEEVLEITEKTFGKTHEEYGKALNNLGTAYSGTGNYSKASTYILEALDVVEQTRGKDDFMYGIISGSLGVLYKTEGDYSKAQLHYLNSLKNLEKSRGKNHPDYLELLNDLGIFYSETGDFQKALEYLTQSLEGIENNLGKNNPAYLNTLTTLGGLFRKAGVYPEAEEYYLEAMETAENIHGKRHSVYGRTANGLGVLYLAMGDYDKAEIYLTAARENLEKSLGPQHIVYGNCLNNLAGLYVKTGQHSMALALFREALENIRENFGESHNLYGDYLFNFATFYDSSQQPEKAYQAYLEGIEILKTQIENLFSFLNEYAKEEFIADMEYKADSYRNFFANYYTVNNDSAGSFYDLELLFNGLVLNSSIELRNRIESVRDTELTESFENLLVHKKQLADEYAKPLTERRPDLKELENKTELLETEVNRSTQILSNMQEIGKISWKDIQNKLGNNEVAIEFSSFQVYHNDEWTDTVQYAALILRKNDKNPIFVPLFTQEELDKITQSTGSEENNVNGMYRGSIVVSARKNHGKLYDLLWKPLEKYLSEGQTVYFAPAGTLHQISLSAVKNSEGKYLLDLYNLVQLGTTAKITERKENPRLNEIVLFGGIDYESVLPSKKTTENNENIISRKIPEDLDKSGLRSGSSGWSYLKGTKDEVLAIEALAKGKNIRSLLFIENAALEENFKNLNGESSPDILHIATHGFFFPDPDSRTGSERLPKDETNVFKISDNPLNRAGLLFAGANPVWKGEKTNKGAEDGILTAYEASQVYLPNTKLVVLSACETGLGDIQGSEGVFGLQRAFKAAGAEYLLMSLWKVPDKETAEFMEGFYRELFASQNFESSYKTAQNLMKQKYPNEPFKWAAFVLMR